MSDRVDFAQHDAWREKLDQRGRGPGGNGVDPPGEEEDDILMRERLAKMEQAHESTKASHALLLSSVALVSAAFLAVLAILAAFQVFSFQSVQSLDAKISARSDAIENKVDTLPSKLADEFRAMRADISAQTSAIANSITAARQVPTQVILVPAPQPPTLPGHTPTR